jgi:hypothetical protein
MATDTAADVEQTPNATRWLYAALLGGLAGLPRLLRDPLAALVGPDSTLAPLFADAFVLGPGAHLVYSVLFGVLFALLLDYEAFDHLLDTPLQGARTGLGYGLVLWTGGSVVAWPLALAVIGDPTAPAFPNLHVGALLGHLAYGLVLGTGYALARRAA